MLTDGVPYFYDSFFLMPESGNYLHKFHGDSLYFL